MYSVLDYLDRLTEITSEDINTALVLTNNTTHENSFLQAPDYVASLTISDYGSSPFKKEMGYHINAGAIKRISEWINFLKKENVYDNTRIIIVSDHGPEPNYVTNLGLPFNVDQFNPLLMVKDFNASGKLITDMSFMSNADVPYLSLNGVIENPKNPFTGNSISIERKKDPLLILIYGSMHVSEFEKSRSQDNLYYVHDNIFKKENWVPYSIQK